MKESNVLSQIPLVACLFMFACFLWEMMILYKWLPWREPTGPFPMVIMEVPYDDALFPKVGDSPGMQGNYTVDGRKPASVEMDNISLLLVMFQASQVVQDFFHPQYGFPSGYFLKPHCHQKLETWLMPLPIFSIWPLLDDESWSSQKKWFTHHEKIPRHSMGQVFVANVRKNTWIGFINI